MAPITTSSDESNHQALLDQLDILAIPKPFRNPNYKPHQRRNKTLKQLVADVSKKDTSMMQSQAGSGYATPQVPGSEATTTGGALTPAVGNGSTGGGERANIVQASQRLDRLVLEKNQQASLGVPESRAGGNPMAVTYTNIESAPSLQASGQKKYCDITGLPARYTDPSSRLRYHNKEIYALIKTMGSNATEAHLAARGAQSVLK
ncbi:chromatin-remodeling complex subunit ies6 [Tothia fuscella]|uniref:Chromatin-remodeling complex subunit ies6 n=1 Tax=Tothia fuscella TaxID=1048955 RepID=A0A9P4NX08_9PEZI|nr:chromatin-remodeling complex subunit ies6 [Tothia fuscella]